MTQLIALGAKPQIPLPLKTYGQMPVALIALDQPNGKEYWLGAQNFYVITRYNHSDMYAMAVYLLSEKIKEKRNLNHDSTLSTLHTHRVIDTASLQ